MATLLPGNVLGGFNCGEKFAAENDNVAVTDLRDDMTFALTSNFSAASAESPCV